ncbi:hypothetical protein Q3G72_026949 [Acer saccharum]|nr:hypothetical protein Q3G72_026949 [Acer saccharum]
METNAYDKALQHIEHSHLVYYSGEELPLNLKIRAGICHIHLRNMEKSELLEKFLTYEALAEKKLKALSCADGLIEERDQGLKNKIRPEIRRMLGEATLHYGHARFKKVAAFADSSRWLQALSVLTEVIMLNPCLPDTYHTLGLVYDNIGNAEKAADPSDTTLRFHLASLYVELGDYQRAAESYGEIVQLCPENVEALKTSAKLYLKSGQIEGSVGILEDYFKSHPSSEVDSGIIDLLASVFMETNAYDKALQHIEHSHLVYYSGEELPLNLKIRAGICHIHLGNME